MPVHSRYQFLPDLYLDLGNFFPSISMYVYIYFLTFLIRVILQSSHSDSLKKFPSKSCPLRYGAAKIQEDTFNLFQAGLREFLGSFGVKTRGNHCNGWRITALSVSASKIVPVLSVSSKLLALEYIVLVCFLTPCIPGILLFNTDEWESIICL